MGLINVLLTFDCKSSNMNKQEFDSLVIKQSSSLRTYAYHFTHDADDADDLVQDTMLKAITLMQEKYTQADDMGKSFAKFIQSLSENDFQKLLQHIPKEIAHGEPADFDSFDKITIEDLKASAGLKLI